MYHTVTLRRDWDYQPKIGASRGHHASRRAELNALADFVERHDEGSMLVVGRRGSGKTSMVIAAVNLAAGRLGPDRTLVPVLMRATSLERDGVLDKKTLLVTLIRSLRRETSRNGPAAAAAFRGIEGLYQSATAARKETMRETSRTTSMSFDLGVYPSYVLALLLLLVGYEWLVPHAWALFAAAVAPAALSRLYRWRRRSTAVDTSVHEYDFADMQHEFEQALQSCSGTHKAVFILDEFDKAAQSAADVMAPLKMLINQGGALYIFITSPDKAGDIEARQSPDYTVFSRNLFVKRPLFAEMEGFIDGIVEARSDGLTDEQYNDLRSYLCYMARTDLFDLHRVISDRIAGGDGHGRPVLGAALDDRERTAANLQRAIKYVYDRKAYGSPSRQRENDEMLEAMYELAARSRDIPNQAITVSGQEIDAGGKPIKFSAHGASAARDLLAVLGGEGYLEGSGDSFTVRGGLSRFKGGMHVEEERAFGRAYEALRGAMVDIANCKSFMDGHGERFDRDSAEDRWDDLRRVVGGAAPVSIPDEIRQCNLSLGDRDRRSMTPDELRQYTDHAWSAVAGIRTASVGLVARALELYLGIPASLGDELPSDLATAAGLAERSVHCAVSDKPDADGEIRLAVVDSQNAATSESFRSAMAGIKGTTDEVVVLLVGDNDPPALEQSFLAIDSIDLVDQVTADAMMRAERHGAYGFALKSPPTVRRMGLLLAAVEAIRERRLSGNILNFHAAWSSLKSVAAGQVRVTEDWFAKRRGGSGTGDEGG